MACDRARVQGVCPRQVARRTEAGVSCQAPAVPAGEPAEGGRCEPVGHDEHLATRQDGDGGEGNQCSRSRRYSGPHYGDVARVGERIYAVERHGGEPASQDPDDGSRYRDIPKAPCAIGGVAAACFPPQERIEEERSGECGVQQGELHYSLRARISSICSARVRSSMTLRSMATSSPPAA